ncbi:MAG: Fic family protein [Polyangiales bacterium]
MSQLLDRFADPEQAKRIPEILSGRIPPAPKGKYLHWDELRYRDPPDGLSVDEWWLAIKFARASLLRPLPLKDKSGHTFLYAMTDQALELVHRTDRDASGRIELAEQVTNPSVRDRYIVNSLIEEAITSSQLEGASTTRKVAKQMLRSGRKPRDRSEQMILNNYEAIQYVRTILDEELKPEHVLQLHEIVTRDTLDEPEKAGTLRTPEDDDVAVYDNDDQKLHHPPPSGELPQRLRAMCRFANPRKGEAFVHPIIRAIALHFWLAYDHPFVDGNGRTARILFYWSMLSQGYWLFEFVSISRILRAAPAQYARSFLYSETDENDLTYFILYQLGVIDRAVRGLHEYLQKKQAEVRQIESALRQHEGLNYRQLALLSHALKHPFFRYTIASHRNSHGVVYQTARTDLIGLAKKGLLEQDKVGQSYVFYPVSGLSEILKTGATSG